MFLESFDTNTGNRVVFFAGNEDGDDSDLQRRALCEFAEEIGQHGNMAKTIGSSTAIELVAINGELKGVLSPAFLSGRHDVKVTSDEGDNVRAGTGESEDEVTSALVVSDVLMLNTTAISGKVRLQAFQDVIDGSVLCSTKKTNKKSNIVLAQKRARKRHNGDNGDTPKKNVMKFWIITSNYLGE